MAKTKRRAGKRGAAVARDRRVPKSGVSKVRQPGLPKPKSTTTRPRKQKPFLWSETARLKRQLKTARMQQQASAEILRAVANASGDVARPLQQIAETTARLFSAPSVSIQLVEDTEFTQEYRVESRSVLAGGGIQALIGHGPVSFQCCRMFEWRTATPR